MSFELPLFPQQASSVAGEVDALYFFVIAVAVVFSLLIAGLIFAFFVRYRRRRADEVGAAVHGSIALEVLWSVVPFLLSMVMFGWGAKVYFTLRRPPSDATEHFVVAKQWMWKFQHPEGQREINELHVPVGAPIKLTMTSEDVIHSFYVPAFRVKADLIPGRYTTVWFQATRTGAYHLFCAEYCGAEHSRMIGRVIVMEPSDYQAWLAGGTGAASVALSGAELFQALACHTCHREDSLARGPALAGLFGRDVVLEGGARVVADETYLRRSILEPTAQIVAGFAPLMPTFQGQVSEEGLVALISYIKSLQPPPASPPAAAGSAR